MSAAQRTHALQINKRSERAIPSRPNKRTFDADAWVNLLLAGNATGDLIVRIRRPPDRFASIDLPAVLVIHADDGEVRGGHQPLLQRRVVLERTMAVNVIRCEVQ